MSVPDDALVRLGIALYRETKRDGLRFYAVQDLVFDHIGQKVPSGLFRKLFRDNAFDFWDEQEELAKGLAQTGIAEHFSKLVEGDAFRRDHYLKLTSFGRTLLEIAHAQEDPNFPSIEGLTLEDALTVLKNEKNASDLASDLSNIDTKLGELNLTNFERSTVNSYVSILVAVSRMPDPDGRLFWIILNRLSQFAGVASLIVAIIALRLGR